ncbi:vWA domain-containing protein [Faecalimonas sp.]
MEREWNVLQKEQQKELEKIDICMEIWEQTKQELYVSMRFFHVVLSRLGFEPQYSLDAIGTNGENVYFSPDTLISLFRQNRIEVNRMYLHMVLHCLFLHFVVPTTVNERYWNLASDIVVEKIIDSLHVRSVKRYVSPYRKNLYQTIEKEKGVLTPKNICEFLQQKDMEEEDLQRMEVEFYRDNHSMWSEYLSPQSIQERNKPWKEDSEKMQTEIETFGKEQSDEIKEVLEQIQVENREKYDYRKFLKKFSVLKEETQVDMDSFDYVFYHYGIELYGNMPLIEPQEMKEVYKVEDFVIAIDTSMSCKGELVKQFLRETYSVLSESESFFRKVCIHIIQCDDKIQSDVVISNEKELRSYMDNFEVKGQGGTDFRPVFVYVNELIKKRAFHHLRGLIYFTDGYGTFPVKRPLYETAFVFVKEDYKDVDVPIWAMKLIIEPEDLSGKVEVEWT